MTTIPRLRSDLLISRQENGDGICFVVKDPLTRRFFRLREHEYAIAQSLDGSTPLEAVRQRIEDQFGASLSLGSLNSFTQKLEQLGLLETGQSRAGRPWGVSQRRIRGNFLYLRLKAFNPDRLFDRLAGSVRFFFTPSFVILSALIILFGAAITITDWGQILHDLRGLYRLDVIVPAWLTMFAVITAHEFAHGLTCKHFGGKVNEIGFLLIYFQPAFYCNVSDAWLFPEKSKRLWVTFAGAYFEVFLWAVATLTWRITGQDTLFSFLALIVMATSGIKTLFNLNPLIKLDGYYLLSDYLEIPNLRQRAFGYLRDRVRRLWGSDGPASAQPSARERRVYLTYGVLAGAFSFYLLGLIALQFGGFLVNRYQGAGFIVFTALVMGVVRLRYKPAPAWGPGNFKPKGKLVGRLKRHGKLLAALVFLAGAVFIGRMELTVGGEFEILPLHNIEVRTEVEGTVGQVYVDEGNVVKKGDVIAQLSDRDYQAELRQTEAEVNEKQAKLRLLYAGARHEEVDLARKQVETATTKYEQARKRFDEASSMRAQELSRAQATVQKAQDRLTYSKKYLGMSTALGQQGLISQREVEQAKEQAAVRAKEQDEAEAELKVIQANDLADAKTALAVASKELDEAKGRLRMLLAGSRPEDIEATEAEVERLESHQHYLTEKLKLLTIRSPIAGVVTTPKLKEKIGQYLKPGDLIAEVHELDSVEALISVPEKEIADVQVGQDVAVKARAYPSRTFDGKVTLIASTATKEADDPRAPRTILVTTRLSNASMLLKPEMTGNAKIYCGKRRIIDLITRRFVRFFRVEFWSWW